MKIAIELEYNSSNGYDMKIFFLPVKPAKIQYTTKPNISFKEVMESVERVFRERLCLEDAYELKTSDITKKISPERVGILERMLDLKNQLVKLKK